MILKVQPVTEHTIAPRWGDIALAERQVSGWGVSMPYIYLEFLCLAQAKVKLDNCTYFAIPHASSKIPWFMGVTPYQYLLASTLAQEYQPNYHPLVVAVLYPPHYHVT
jgi:hypothetical protein